MLDKLIVYWEFIGISVWEATYLLIDEDIELKKKDSNKKLTIKLTGRVLFRGAEEQRGQGAEGQR